MTKTKQVTDDRPAAPCLVPAPPAGVTPEAASGKNEERYRKLLMLSPDANFVHVDGMITLVNEAFCRLMRATSSDQLIGSPAMGIVEPVFHELVRQRQKKHFDNQPVAPADMRFIRLDGTLIDVEVNAMAFDLLGHKEVQVIARDISARLQAVTALHESEERFKFVARAVSDVVWDWNLVLNTLWWNDGFLTTFGFTAGEIEPSVQSWTGRIHPDDRVRVAESMQEAIRSRRETWSANYRFQRKNGSHAFVHDNGFILRDAEGRGIRMVGGMRDLTEEKEIETRHLRAERMESIGTLAGGIAHDLNNVLAPIMMSIELLKQSSKVDSRDAKILDVIQVSCRRGAALVRQVLSFALGLGGHRVTFQLPAVIGELESVIKETFPRNIRIVFKTASDLNPITGDPTQVHQLLLNLLVNARDAMPAGGVLTLTAGNFAVDAQYSGTSPEAKAGPYVLLQITDTGSGIEPEVIKRIFEPFFTTKAPGSGTGMGLATVHTIVKAHEGFVTVDSELRHGTTFKVYLPADHNHVAGSTVPFQLEPPHGQDELVMVVDDELSIREITQQTLEAFGYRVITANNGIEAIALYAKRSSQIALVITDIMMPVMDGGAAIQVMLKINPHARIIASSGIDSGDENTRVAQAGVKDLLPKPYTAATLLKRVREVLDRPSSQSPIVPPAGQP